MAFLQMERESPHGELSTETGTWEVSHKCHIELLPTITIRSNILGSQLGT